MKRFGVRLAAGAVTIFLGVLAAVQAQRGTADTSDTTWSASDPLALQEPPRPIGGSDTTFDGDTFAGGSWASGSEQNFPNGPDDSRPSFGGDAPSTASFASSASFNQVMTVSHDVPVDDGSEETGTLQAAPATFSMGPATFAGEDTTGIQEDVQPVEAPMSFGVADLPQLPGPDTRSDASSVSDTFAVQSEPVDDTIQPVDAPTVSEITMPAMNMSFGAASETDSANRADASSAGPSNDLRNSTFADSGSSSAPQDLPSANSFANGSGFAQPQSIAGLPEPRSLPGIQTPNSLPSAASNPPADPSFGGAEYGQPAISPQLSRVAAADVQPLQTISTPGDRRLDGAQSPSVMIQKRAPSQVKVGKAASFTIQVQNVGSVEALDVQVHDSVPQGMRLIEASPQPQADRQGNLVWALGALEPGGERTVTMQLIPEQEGELGSVARVTFEAAASVRTISTRPQLEVVQRAPEQVLIGQQAEIEIEISNPGTGIASGVIVQEDVPQQFEHPYGRELDKPIGDLQPGEVRREVLRMRAVAPGMVRNTLRVVGDDGLEAIHTVDVEVIAPLVQVQLSGPGRRFLERQATYQLDFANTGTATANNVQFVAQLDRGFKFVSAENQGFYDATTHTVTWQLKHLNAGQSGASQMTLLPVEVGDQVIRVQANSELTETVVHEAAVAIDSLSELTFQIADTADPIEVGGETTYELRVRNSGSRGDSNVMVQFQLPPGMQLLGTDLDSNNDGRGNIVFTPAPQLASGDELVYRVKVRGDVPGNHLIKAIVQSSESELPVTKEESTKVYSDR